MFDKTFPLIRCESTLTIWRDIALNEPQLVSVGEIFCSGLPCVVQVVVVVLVWSDSVQENLQCIEDIERAK